MKAETYTLISDQVKEHALARIDSLVSDGKIKVTISDAGTKSARQRGLQHVWYRDVVKSGVGGKYEEDEESLDLFAKWKWVRPILIRENDLFADIFTVFMRDYGTDEAGQYQADICRSFTKHWIHTEDLTVNQMAEFLTNFQNYYLEKGVTLSDPQDRKLLEYDKRLAA